MLTVPGRGHEGALPAATAEERDVAARLRAHVTTIASEPHNVQYYAALERAAQYIEATLEAFNYTLDRRAGASCARDYTVKSAPLTSANGDLSALVKELIIDLTGEGTREGDLRLGRRVFQGDSEAVPSDTDAADRWRALAGEARAKAAEMTDAEAKRIMLSIAEGYERLARRAEAGKNPKNSN